MSASGTIHASTAHPDKPMSGAAGRNLEDHGPLPEIQHHADERRLVFSEELVTRQRQPGQVDDVVVPGPEVANGGFAQARQAHRRHSPDRGLDAALVRELIGEVLIQFAPLLDRELLGPEPLEIAAPRGTSDARAPLR